MRLIAEEYVGYILYTLLSVEFLLSLHAIVLYANLGGIQPVPTLSMSTLVGTFSSMNHVFFYSVK